MKKHIIAVTTVKGGVAKTTTADALAEAAALDNKKVLAIDFDGQGSLSVWNDAAGSPETVYNAFTGGSLAAAILHTSAGYDLIPASGNLVSVERMNAAAKVNGITAGRVLEKAIEPIKKNYDVIVIDTPPTMGNLQTNAIFAANEVICPLEPDINAIRGFYTVMDIISQARRAKRNIHVLGALTAIYDARPRINRELREMIAEAAAEYNTPYLGEVRKTVKIPEAQALRMPLYQYAPKCTAALDYMEIYKKIMEG